MQIRLKPSAKFRTRREAEKVLADIVASGGREEEYRIDEDKDGACIIIIFESDGVRVAGTLGA